MKRRGKQDQPDWRELLERAHEQIRSELRGRPLPPPEEVIHAMREERDAQIDAQTAGRCDPKR